MNISAETYIVISLMFAVFAAVAAVGTSVVLGAGFERLRAGFDLIKRQSGFFSDAIYKLDQRTQKLSEETAKLKSGVYNIGERVDKVEKQTAFMADAVNSIEQRILQGTPSQPQQPPVQQYVQPAPIPMQDVRSIFRGSNDSRPRETQPRIMENLTSPLFRDYPEEAPAQYDRPYEEGQEILMEEPADTAKGLTTLLSRYLTGETSGGGKVVYH